VPAGGQRRYRPGKASALFAGDAESEDDGPCQAEPQLQHLLKRFGKGNLLGVKLYHATHHGSKNGVLDDLMKKVNPRAGVISAGTLINRENGFHAFAFGHPRKEAIDSLTKFTKGSRPPKTVEVMTVDGGNHPDAQPSSVLMKKAVYCTCWDGTIDIAFDAVRLPRSQHWHTRSRRPTSLPRPSAPGSRDEDSPGLLPALSFLVPAVLHDPRRQVRQESLSMQRKLLRDGGARALAATAGVTGGNGQPRNCRRQPPSLRTSCANTSTPSPAFN
jgi:hypothetical protein